MMPHAAASMMNPRVIRDRFKEWQGKRVTVGLTTDHYLCGTWTAADLHQATFEIGGKEMTVPLVEIANLAEAPPLQSDFFK
jgi:hypothetical protein